MILEGVVTTLAPDGSVNIAPMGPRVEPGDWSSFELRPYRTSRTHANLTALPEGVLHVTDDVLLLARAAVGDVAPPPELKPASEVRGYILANACRAYEFRAGPFDPDEERPRLRAEVVRVHRLRDFFGLNRAMHAVVEAAILATRTAFLPLGEIEAEFRRLAVLVEKTGGPAEREAFAFLTAHLEREKAGRNSP
jgi:uncharacterized protein